MFKSLLLAACMVVGAASQAKTISVSEAIAFSTAKFAAEQVTLTDAFNVGDNNSYNLSVMGMSGTMVMKVTGVTPSALTIQQDISIMGQQQQAITVINPNTGEVISITVNGQKQEPPPPGDTEIISHTSATITVPAGTFNCQDIKTHSKSQNTDSEQWVDMSGTVPVGGMLKMSTTAQGMPVTAELTKYTKVN